MLLYVFLHNNPFYKNREAQYCQKIKIILRIVLRLKASDLIRIWTSSLKNQDIVKGEWFLEVLLFSTQNLIKSLCVVYASEPCFELRAQSNQNLLTMHAILTLVIIIKKILIKRNCAFLSNSVTKLDDDSKDISDMMTLAWSKCVTKVPTPSHK